MQPIRVLHRMFRIAGTVPEEPDNSPHPDQLPHLGFHGRNHQWEHGSHNVNTIQYEHASILDGYPVSESMENLPYGLSLNSNPSLGHISSAPSAPLALALPAESIYPTETLYRDEFIGHDQEGGYPPSNILELRACDPPSDSGFLALPMDLGVLFGIPPVLDIPQEAIFASNPSLSLSGISYPALEGNDSVHDHQTADDLPVVVPWSPIEAGPQIALNLDEESGSLISTRYNRKISERIVHGYSHPVVSAGVPGQPLESYLTVFNQITGHPERPAPSKRLSTGQMAHMKSIRSAGGQCPPCRKKKRKCELHHPGPRIPRAARKRPTPETMANTTPTSTSSGLSSFEFLNLENFSSDFLPMSSSS